MLWILVRSLIVVGGALQGPAIARWKYPDASLSVLAGHLVVMLTLGAGIVVLLTAMAKMGIRAGNRWELPSWRIKPLPGGPVQVFHALAWYFIAGGVSAIVATLWVRDPSLEGGVVLLGLGTGFLVGCRASVRLFRPAFADR